MRTVLTILLAFAAGVLLMLWMPNRPHTTTSAAPVVASLPAVPATAPPKAMVTAIYEGARWEFPVAAGEAIIDAAMRAGRNLPFSCKGGMCCTCRAKLLEGRVEMTVNYSLEPWETAAGYVLTCQAPPTTPRIVVDYDHV